jgi:hypothetical protein
LLAKPNPANEPLHFTLALRNLKVFRVNNSFEIGKNYHFGEYQIAIKVFAIFLGLSFCRFQGN